MTTTEFRRNLQAERAEHIAQWVADVSAVPLPQNVVIARYAVDHIYDDGHSNRVWVDVRAAAYPPMPARTRPLNWRALTLWGLAVLIFWAWVGHLGRWW